MLLRARLRHPQGRREPPGTRPGRDRSGIEVGLGEAGIFADRIETVFSEREAIARAVGQMGERDLVVVPVDDVSSVLEQLLPFRSTF